MTARRSILSGVARVVLATSLASPPRRRPIEPTAPNGWQRALVEPPPVVVTIPADAARVLRANPGRMFFRRPQA